MGAGRNDPCPCGSGVKYKPCCLGKEAAGWGVFTAAEREQVLGALMRFADREEFDAHHERRAGTDARMAGSMSG